MRVELSVVLPALDEEAGLSAVLPALKKELAALGVSFEILIVDGGSQDATAEVARREGARLVSQASRGFGGAVREGFREARGEWILVLDADGSHPAGMLPRLWRRRGGRELVIGSRYMPGGSAELSWPRLFLSRLLNRATGWFLGWPVFDASSGLRLYRASAVRGLPLRCPDFSIQQEALAHILAAGGSVVEEPFHFLPRLGGKTKARVLSLARSYIRMLLELKVLLEGPGALAGPVLVMAIGLGAGLWGIGWGLPGPQRLRAFPESLKPTPEIARRLADDWARLYEEIRRSHREMSQEEPVTYAQGVVELAPGWDFPPPELLNSYRSFLLQSENPDEKKSFIILSQMRPWKLEFKPLYIQYGGAFIYPLGAFLKAASWAGAARLVPGVGHYLLHPGDMGRLYLLGRLFVLAFVLGSLWLLYDMGRSLSGWRTGVWAALFFALSPMALVNAHVVKPHPYAAFWCLAAVRYALMALEGGGRRAYLLGGLCAGMAAASNFTFACFALVGLIAWLERRRTGAAGPEELRWAALGASAAAGVCVLWNPYLLLSYGEFAWERRYARGTGLAPGTLPAVIWKVAIEGLGPGVSLAAAAGMAAALVRRPPRTLVLMIASMFLALWVLLSEFGGGFVATGRYYYPVAALACLPAAAFLAELPARRMVRGLCLAAVLADLVPRGGAFLENMRRDAGPRSTRLQAAAWIEEHAAPGSSIGLVRYPDPAHIPPFRYDRYRLVVFRRPEDLESAGLPDYLAADEHTRAPVDKWAKNKYDLVKAIVPWGAAWARVADESFFANTGVYLYKRKAPPK